MISESLKIELRFEIKSWLIVRLGQDSGDLVMPTCATYNSNALVTTYYIVSRILGNSKTSELWSGSWSFDSRLFKWSTGRGDPGASGQKG